MPCKKGFYGNLTYLKFVLNNYNTVIIYYTVDNSKLICKQSNVAT